MYHVNTLCYCKHVHRLLTKIKFDSNIGVRNPLFFLIFFFNKTLEWVTEKILLICMYYTY